MKGAFTQYLIGALLVGFSAYQILQSEFVEFVMYFTAGLGFLTTGLIKHEVLTRYHQILKVMSWIFIFVAGFLLLFLFRTDP